MRVTDVRPTTWHPSGDDDARAAALAADFRETYGEDPAGVWAAPGRVNLIGEHVDYAGGRCLPLALPHSTLVAAGPGPVGRVLARSRQRPDEPLDVLLADVAPGTPPGWGSYVAGVAAVLLGPSADGLRLLVDSTVPVGAGLSSSAALSCSAALALDHLAGLGRAQDDAGRAWLAAACVRAENEIAQAHTGGMDQSAVLRSRAGSALLLDCRDGSVTHLALDLAGSGLALLVMDTRTEHVLADGQYAARRSVVDSSTRRLGVSTLRELVGDDEEEVLRRLDEDARPLVRHVLTEMARVDQAEAALRRGDLPALGPLLDASHASLRDDFGVSTPELDLAVDSAVRSGALGARLTGGGFGGSAIALVPGHLVETVAACVQGAASAAGFAVPAFLLAEPSQGAHRVR